MRAPLLCLVLVVGVMAVTAAPDRNALETGTKDNESPFVEEVVVETQLHVRSPSTRQGRTNARVNLQDGARVAEANNI